jgi:hypothetical protein
MAIAATFQLPMILPLAVQKLSEVLIEISALRTEAFI